MTTEVTPNRKTRRLNTTNTKVRQRLDTGRFLAHPIFAARYFTFQNDQFLGVFEKLRKASINFVMFACPSVGSHATTR